MKVDLVFEGGGVLGISFAGAIKALGNRGYSVERCAGTSAGSIVSALLMAGYTPCELEKILYKTDFKRFIKNRGIGRVWGIGTLLSLLFNNGQYDSEVIEAWMDELLKEKGVTKFRDVMSKGKSRLKVIAADITTRRMLILPDDLSKYKIDPSEYSIARAVRMSCAIPFFFTPVKMKYDGGLSYIVDGGLLSSFPIWIFDMEGTMDRPTLGIKIKDPASNTSQGKTGLISYLKDIIDTPINKDEEYFIRDKDCVRTIVLDYDGIVHPTDFGSVHKHTGNLFKMGYDSTMKFLNKWDYNRYKEMFIKNKGL